MATKTTLQSFTKAKSTAEFDWKAFLQKKDITDEEWEDAENLARSWITCATGHMCDLIPRNISAPYAPEDFILCQLGGAQGFHAAVEEKNAKLAFHLLSLIEQHSSYLLSQIKERLIYEVDEKKKTIKALNDNGF